VGTGELKKLEKKPLGKYELLRSEENFAKEEPRRRSVRSIMIHFFRGELIEERR